MLFPWWIKYPNSNNEILNLDWLEYTVKHLSEEVKNFINLNTIKYADPILWDITHQYEANTIVIDAQTGNAYISTKAVPSGVSLNRTEYWTQIYNYADELHVLRNEIAFDEGNTTTASKSFDVDDLVFVNEQLYRVISAMIAGDSFVVDGNVVNTTIEEELQRISTSLYNEITVRATADAQLQGNIDAEATARANSDTQLQGNIDAEAAARVNADTQLQNQINQIRTFNPLSGKIILVGDSLTVGVGATYETGLGYAIANACNKTVGEDAFIMAQSGCAFVTANDGGVTYPSFEQIMISHESDISNPEEVSAIIVVGGTNDALRGIDIDTLTTYVNSLFNYCKTHYSNALVFYSDNLMFNNMNTALANPSYVTAFASTFLQNRCIYIGSSSDYLKKIYLQYLDTQADLVHPNAKGYALLGKAIYNWIMCTHFDFEVVNKFYLNNPEIDSSVYTNGKFIHYEDNRVNVYNAGNATFNTFSPSTNIDNLKIATITEGLPFANIITDAGWVKGQGTGCIYVTHNNVSSWKQANMLYRLNDTGHIEIFATCLDDSYFAQADSIDGIWCQVKLDAKLSYIQLIV